LLLTLCCFLRGIIIIIVVVVMEIATARLEVQQLRQGEPAALVTYTVVPDYFKNQIELTLWP
jgi:hypothetical protein